jgi:hypothetical protein
VLWRRISSCAALPLEPRALAISERVPVVNGAVAPGARTSRAETERCAAKLGATSRVALSHLSSSSIRDPPFMLAVAIIWPPGRQANLNGPVPKTSGPSLKSLRCLCLRQQVRREDATRRSSSGASPGRVASQQERHATGLGEREGRFRQERELRCTTHSDSDLLIGPRRGENALVSCTQLVVALGWRCSEARTEP